MRRCISNVAVVVAALAVLVLDVGAAQAAKRVALVIGNSAYTHAGELANPRNDAADMAAAFKKLGFQVVEGINLDKPGFDRKIRDFANALKGADVGVFFYAGHGLQVGGQNYLVPIDAELSSSAALDFEMIRLDLIHRTMEGEAQTNIIFLDACRNNPLERNLRRAMGTRSAEIGRGLAAVESGVGTLISFSTQPGNVAVDGTGRNSPFASALVKHMSNPNDDLSAILIAVRNDVMTETRRQQVPWEHSALTGRVYFGAGPAAVAPASSQPITGEAERMWGSIKDSTDVADLEAFRAQYGKAHPFHDRLADKRIGELKKQQVAALPPPPAPRRIDPAPATVGNYAVERVSAIAGRAIGSRQLSFDASKPEGGIAACAAACDSTTACVAFELSLVYSKCTVFENVEKTTSLGGYISGVKRK